MDGTGITVGVISDSFNTSGNGSAAADVASGDLPAAGVDVLADEPDGTDEGRAMAQIVHDVAPGSAIDFHTAGEDQPDFVQAIAALDAAGCQVICDDVGFIDEPYFQDAIGSEEINNIVAGGTTYLSAAGNDGTQSYQAAFNASSTTGPGGGALQNFGGGTTEQMVTVPVGDQVNFGLQWTQAFKSLGGSGAASQMNIYLVDNTGTIVAEANDSVVGGDADQIMSFGNDGSFGTGGGETQFGLLIELQSGPAPTLVKYIAEDDGGGATIDTFNTDSGTSIGHADSSGAIAVAAAPYFLTPGYNQSPADLENFSSEGGVPQYFDDSGNLLSSPVVYQTPAVTGPDGVNTTFFGDTSDDLPDNPVEFNFFGTSAATPHVAGLAALMLQAGGGPGSRTPAQIRTDLEDSASPISTRVDPFDTSDTTAIPGPTGVNYYAGYGFVNAVSAVKAADAPPVFTIDSLTQSSGPTGETPFIFNVRLSKPAPSTETVDFATEDGTASASAGDYTATSGTLTFAAGTDSQSITVYVKGTTVLQASKTFSVVLSDASQGTELGTPDQGTATILYNSSLPPNAVNDKATVNDGSSVTIPVLANDTDPDSTLVPSTVTVTGGPPNGVTVVNKGDGSIVYTPDANFVGTDVFYYTVQDARGLTSNEGKVTITVLPMNVPPIASDVYTSTAVGTPLTIDLADSVTAPTNAIDPTSFQIVSGRSMDRLRWGPMAWSPTRPAPTLPAPMSLLMPSAPPSD